MEVWKMVETRTRILGIAPYQGMNTVMERAAQAYPNIQLDVFTGDLEVGAATSSMCVRRQLISPGIR